MKPGAQVRNILTWRTLTRDGLTCRAVVDRALISFAAFVYLAACAVTTSAQAASPTTLMLTPAFGQGYYRGSLFRDRFTDTSLTFDLWHAQDWGLGAGFDRTKLYYKLGLPTLSQDAWQVNTHASYAPSTILGRLGVYLGLYTVADSARGGNGDGVRVVAPLLSFWNTGKTLNLNIGYAHSHYSDSATLPGALTVTQWTPSIGVAVRPARDWVELRGDYIRASNPLRAQGKSTTSALTLGWTHYPLLKNKLYPAQIKAAFQMGTRMFAVDQNTGVVLNFGEPQVSAFSVAAQWRIDKSTSVGLLLARERFQEQLWSGVNSYSKEYAYITLSRVW